MSSGAGVETQHRGAIDVAEGPERDVPASTNVEGQAAAHTDAAEQALPTRSHSTTSEQAHEKQPPAAGGNGGRPVMDKYAYHCMSPFHLASREAMGALG